MTQFFFMSANEAIQEGERQIIGAEEDFLTLLLTGWMN